MLNVELEYDVFDPLDPFRDAASADCKICSVGGAIPDTGQGGGGGSNAGCGTGGFAALQGWDAVTGWGTPNMGKMAAVTDALP